MKKFEFLLKKSFSEKNLIFFPFKNNDWVAFAPGKSEMILLPDASEKSVNKAINQLKPIKPIKLKPLQRLVLFPTSQCNMTCRYCYAHGGENPKNLDKETAKVAIDYFIKNMTTSYPLFSFHGNGEPSIQHDFLEWAINYIKSKTKFISGMFSIGTNGFMKQKTLNLLIENGFRFSVSYDGLPEIQNFQRPLKNKKNKSNEVVENTLKKIAKSKSFYSISCTLLPQNLQHLTNIVNHVADLGLTNLGLHLVFPRGRAEKIQKKEEDYLNYQALKTVAIEIAKKRKINISFTDILTSHNPRCAFSSLTTMAVTAEGFITGCIEVCDKKSKFFNDLIIGKIDLEKKDVVINHKKVELLSNRLDNMKACTNCVIRNICCGGCPITALDVNKSIFIPDFNNCKITKIEMMDLLYRMAEETFT